MTKLSAFVRQRTLQALGTALCLIFATAAPAASSANTLEEAKASKSIRIGYANEAPYSFMSINGVLNGEAPIVAKAVLARMGITEVEGVLTEFGALIPGLQAKRFDIIAAGMYITPARCKQILFSEPSYGIGQSLLVKKGNPKQLADYASIKADKGLKLAVLAGAVETGYATGAGVDRSQLLILPDQSSLAKSVQSGRADAAAASAVAINAIAAKAADIEATKPFGKVSGKSVKGHGGFGFRKEDREFQAEFNKHLQAYIGSAEHLRAVTPLGFGADYLPDKSTAQLCAGK